MFVNIPTDAICLNNQFGSGAGRTFIRDAGCTGSESRLIDCSYTSGLCQNSQQNAVGIRCQGEIYIFEQ